MKVGYPMSAYILKPAWTQVLISPCIIIATSPTSSKCNSLPVCVFTPNRPRMSNDHYINLCLYM